MVEVDGSCRPRRTKLTAQLPKSVGLVWGRWKKDAVACRPHDAMWVATGKMKMWRLQKRKVRARKWRWSELDRAKQDSDPEGEDMKHWKGLGHSITKLIMLYCSLGLLTLEAVLWRTALIVSTCGSMRCGPQLHGARHCIVICTTVRHPDSIYSVVTSQQSLLSSLNFWDWSQTDGNVSGNWVLWGK